MTAGPQLGVRIDRDACARRLEEQLTTLAAPPFSASWGEVTRYAFTAPYRNTLRHLAGQLKELGFRTRLDPIGNFVARNCPDDVDAVGLGSHCDSVRGGGAYDGILGVLAAVEVARNNVELGLGLPLQVVSWVEEEASGFGQMLLGSRVIAGEIDPTALKADIRSIDDGRPYYEHAREIGLDPDRLADERSTLAGMAAWLELHIEQARVLEDSDEQLGVVEAIAGYVHGDLDLVGQSDHAGATPMGLRHDAAALAAECVLELERLATEAGGGAVGTVGEIAAEPGAINIIPGRVRLSLDIRARDQAVIDDIHTALLEYAAVRAEQRGLSAVYHERQRVAPTALDARIIDALARTVGRREIAWRRMVSGAAHDTMCVARHVPSAMLFVPCRAGISHSPDEWASAAHAAFAVEILLEVALAISGQERGFA